MYVKIHESYRNVVAICDSELIGKHFEEGKRQLEIGEHFFKGTLETEEKVIAIIQRQSIEDSTFNIVGEKSTQAAIKSGLITKEEIDYIQEIPFVIKLI